MSAQIALARPRLPRYRHCLLSLRRFQRRSRFPQTVCPAPAPGLGPVVKVVARTMWVVGRPVARVVTVAAAVCHFDTMVPESVKELCLVDSMPPAPLHSASYYAIGDAQPRHKRGEIGHAPAAFPIPIGDSGAPEVRDSVNRAVAVVDSPGRLIPVGDRHVM